MRNSRKADRRSCSGCVWGSAVLTDLTIRASNCQVKVVMKCHKIQSASLDIVLLQKAGPTSTSRLVVRGRRDGIHVVQSFSGKLGHYDACRCSRARMSRRHSMAAIDTLHRGGNLLRCNDKTTHRSAAHRKPRVRRSERVMLGSDDLEAMLLCCMRDGMCVAAPALPPSMHRLAADRLFHALHPRSQPAVRCVLRPVR